MSSQIALLEEEKDEDVEINAAEDVDDEGKPSENDLSSVEPNKSGGSDEKPDINNIPMEVSEVTCYDHPVLVSFFHLLGLSFKGLISGRIDFTWKFHVSL